MRRDSLLRNFNLLIFEMNVFIERSIKGGINFHIIDSSIESTGLRCNPVRLSHLASHWPPLHSEQDPW